MTTKPAFDVEFKSLGEWLPFNHPTSDGDRRLSQSAARRLLTEARTRWRKTRLVRIEPDGRRVFVSGWGAD